MKKINQKGFAHHLLIFGLLALVVGAAGFAGYRVWKNKNIDAQAAGWTSLGWQDPYEVNFYACKVSIAKSNNYYIKGYMSTEKTGSDRKGVSVSGAYMTISNKIDNTYKTVDIGSVASGGKSFVKTGLFVTSGPSANIAAYDSYRVGVYFHYFAPEYYASKKHATNWLSLKYIKSC